MAAAHNIVVLGGGVGGQVVANELRRLLPTEHRVIVIERNRRHAFAPSFLWVMTGDRRSGQVTRDLRGLVHPGVEVIEADIRAIDLANRRVQLDRDAIAYDYLVVALGADLAPETFPSLADAAHTFYTLEGAARLQTALDAMAGGRGRECAALQMPRSTARSRDAHRGLLPPARPCGEGGRARNAAAIRGAASTTTFSGDGFCMLEAGDDLAGLAFGDFFHQPSPHVRVKPTGRAWHLGKVLFEKWWLSPWGIRRSLLKSALAVGGRIYGVPVNL